MNSRSKYRQRGMTTMGIMMVLVLVVFVGTMAIKLAPVYIEHFKVTSVLNAVKDDPQLTDSTDIDIKKTMTNRFSINDIDDVKASSVQITRKSGHITSLMLDYEVRVHMFWNIDAVVHFKEVAGVAS
jgi:hypothetical protein